MKATLTLFLLIVTVLPSYGQDFLILQDQDQNVVNGSLIVRPGDADAFVMDQGVVAILNGGPGRNVNVRRYELDVQEGTMNYFCWGICYGPQNAGDMPVWNSLPQHSLDLEDGVPAMNFHAYHVPQNVEGSSTYRYVWFDVASPSDSVWVDIQFQSLAVSVPALASFAEMDIFPNPVLDGEVTFNLNVTGMPQVVDLVVYNTLGERLHTATVRNGQQRNVLDTRRFAPGIYFASLELHGTSLLTKRFVISDR